MLRRQTQCRGNPGAPVASLASHAWPWAGFLQHSLCVERQPRSRVVALLEFAKDLAEQPAQQHPCHQNILPSRHRVRKRLSARPLRSRRSPPRSQPQTSMRATGCLPIQTTQPSCPAPSHRSLLPPGRPHMQEYVRGFRRGLPSMACDSQFGHLSKRTAMRVHPCGRRPCSWQHRTSRTSRPPPSGPPRKAKHNLQSFVGCGSSESERRRSSVYSLVFCKSNTAVVGGGSLHTPPQIPEDPPIRFRLAVQVPPRHSSPVAETIGERVS